MKRFFLLMFMASPIWAVTQSDIPTIHATVRQLVQHASKFERFSDQLQILKDNNFTFTIADSTNTITLSPSQKQDLLIYYNQLLSDLDAIRAQFP